MAGIVLSRLLQKSNIRKPRHIDSTFHLPQMRYPQDILVGTSNIVDQQESRNEMTIQGQEQEK
jgi:hypothetical protein